MIIDIIAKIIDKTIEFYNGVKDTIIAPVEVNSTWSNIFYIIGGVWIMFTFPLMWFYGAILSILGLASAMFHGTRNRTWRIFDECMMYMTFITAINGILFLSGYISYAGYILMSIIFGSVLMSGWKWLSSFKVVPSLFIITWLLFFFHSGLMIFSFWLLILFVGATLVNLLSFKLLERGNFKSYDLLHSFWHFLTAYGLTDIILQLQYLVI